MNNIETMQQVYLIAQEHCGLKVGDWVKVIRKNEHLVDTTDMPNE